MSEAPVVEAPAVEAVEAPVSQPAGVDDPSEAAVEAPEGPTEAPATPAQPVEQSEPPEPPYDVVALADAFTPAAVRAAWDAMPADWRRHPELAEYGALLGKVTDEVERLQSPTYTRRRGRETWTVAPDGTPLLSYERPVVTKPLSDDPVAVHVRQAYAAAALEREAQALERVVADESAPVAVWRDADKRVRKARADANTARWALTHTEGHTALEGVLAALRTPPAVPVAPEEPPRQPETPAASIGRW